MQPSIKINASNEIDPEKWDFCIASHEHGLVYAQYHYLNYLSTNWSAIIVGNYQAVMPLPWKMKWGIRYYNAVPFCQQLGLIGQIDKNWLPQIIHLVKEFASYGDLFLNYNNHDLAIQVPSLAKINLVLRLDQLYSTIAAGYTKDLLNNLEKAQKAKLAYNVSTKCKLALQMYQEHYGSRFKNIEATDFQQLWSLIEKKEMDGQTIVREVVNINNKIVAIALLLKDNKRLYLLINAITKKGRVSSANHFLLDQIIREFASTHLLFDFEGSEIAGVRQFYENFNPEIQPYYHFHHNRLAWPFRLIKK